MAQPKQPEKSLFEQYCEEVKTGGLSVLSDKAIHRIILMFSSLQQEAHQRGLEEGIRQMRKP
jgi:hypothetical protein